VTYHGARHYRQDRRERAHAGTHGFSMLLEWATHRKSKKNGTPIVDAKIAEDG